MERGKGHVPIRTCVSCGAKRGKKELSRLKLDAKGLLVRDVGGEGQGRGAYVCLSKPCWDSLAKGNRLSRAFKKKGPVAFHPRLWPYRF